jgi:hypothetical protein
MRRTSRMNRKTLALPAVAGLLAPLLVACGGSDENRAIVVGTTDQFLATAEAPGPSPTTRAPGTSCGRPYRP